MNVMPTLGNHQLEYPPDANGHHHRARPEREHPPRGYHHLPPKPLTMAHRHVSMEPMYPPDHYHHRERPEREYAPRDHYNTSPEGEYPPHEDHYLLRSERGYSQRAHRNLSPEGGYVPLEYRNMDHTEGE